MQHRRYVRYPGQLAGAAAAALALFGLAAAPGPARAAASAPALTRTASAGAVTAPAGPVPDGGLGGQRLLLLNGDQLIISPGQTAAGLLPVPGAGPVLTLRLGRQGYYLPTAALPYLGHGLDPSLFQASALARAETGGRLPVRLTFAGPAPRLPGVTITRSSAGLAAGYLTAASAPAFGAALARQYAADRSHASFGTDGLFARGLDIALPGAPGLARPASRGLRLRALTVTGTDVHGKPDTGDSVFVINVDNMNKFGDPIESQSIFYHGAARFAVPAGHYFAAALFSDPTFSYSRLDVLPQFTVRGPRAAAHLAALAASSEVSATTARRSVSKLASFTLTRSDALGNQVGFSLTGPNLRVSPTTRKPAAGTLSWVTYLVQVPPAGTVGPPWTYDLTYAGSNGLIPVQHYRVAQASLATLHDRFYANQPSTGLWDSTEGVIDQGVFYFQLFPQQLPGSRTEYVTAGPQVAWWGGYYSADTSTASGQFATPVSFRPGQQLTMNWNAYPLHPQPATQPLRGALAAAYPVQPSALRAGNQLHLAVVPFSDNYPGHTSDAVDGLENEVTGSYAIDQNGRQIAHGNPLRPAASRPSR